MKNKEIINSVKKIYERFKVPPNLQMHMIRVTAVANLICDNWKGPDIDKELIIAVSLIHDLGNIAKMNFKDPEQMNVHGTEPSKADYWLKVQEEIRKKYPGNDHETTEKMVAELNVSKRFMEIIRGKEFRYNKEIRDNDDWEVKICAYSDQRVGPQGILSLQGRLDDAIERYKDKYKIFTSPHSEMLKKAAFDFEKQIFEHLEIETADINHETVEPYIAKYA